jgi:DNA-binding IclR family transcriptional regulator
MLKVLDVFSEVAPVWTVDRMIGRLGYTRSTVYRYVKELCEAGLLAPVGGGGYTLGPRIIELDRQIRQCDPLLIDGRDLVADLLPRLGRGVMFICSLLGDEVVSVFRRAAGGGVDISYGRGRPMPLFRGSASQVVLAHLPEWRLTKLFLYHRRDIQEAGLGAEWEEFRSRLREIRRQPYLTTRAQLDPGVFAVSAPVFDGDGNILGSLTFAMPEARGEKEPVEPIADLVVEGAAALSRAVVRKTEYEARDPQGDEFDGQRVAG